LSNNKFPFKVLEIEDEKVTLRDRKGIKTVVKINQEIDTWSLMATIEKDGELMAIFENHEDKNGPILYINSKGTIAKFSKTLESTRVPEESCYLGRTLKDVLESDQDLLGEEILSSEDDPSYEKVASCLPPLQRLGSSNLVSFVGTRQCIDKPAIMEGIRTSCFNPGSVTQELRHPERGEVRPPREIYQGLVGGWLPVLHYQVDKWKIIIFADPEPPTRWIQPVWFRFVRLRKGHIQEIHYCNTYSPLPPRSEPDPKEFYLKLLKLFEDWQSVLEPSMEIDVPEEWIIDLCKHSLVREMITRIGDWPKYGVFTLDYNGPEHDGFQDIFNTSVNAMLEWGLFDVARRYVKNYLSYFVRDDGSIQYRGFETGEYGRHLTIISKYYNYTKDHTMLLKYYRKIKAIVNYLLALREKAKKLPGEDPAYGMIKGWCEADSCGRPNPYIYNLPFYSNSTEAIRGFHDIGKVFLNIGKRLGREDLIKEGEELVEQSEELKKDLYKSIEKSMLTDTEPPHLPGVAGAKKPYDKLKPEKYRKNSWVAGEISRCYNEMLYSGCLTKNMVKTIIRYQSKHGGRWLGLPGRRGSMDGFTSYEYAYGLLQHDLIREFLLFYYAHMAHIYTRGTWTATEYGYADRSQPSSAYCAPAQLTIPALTKWMLVFEDPFLPIVWLTKGTPRPWLKDGKTITVKGALTRWGTLSYKISSNLNKGRINIELNLPEEGFSAAINLRLRTPSKQKIQKVNINGKIWTNFKPEEEMIMLPAGSKGRNVIEVFTASAKV